MKFKFTFANGEIEIVELDATTVSGALNTRIGNPEAKVKCEPYPPPRSLFQRFDAWRHPQDFQPPR